MLLASLGIFSANEEIMTVKVLDAVEDIRFLKEYKRLGKREEKKSFSILFIVLLKRIIKLRNGELGRTKAAFRRLLTR